MDCSLPGSFVRGIFQARILEWVAIPSPPDFLTQGLKLILLYLLHWQVDFFITESSRKPMTIYISYQFHLSLKFLWVNNIHFAGLFPVLNDKL